MLCFTAAGLGVITGFWVWGVGFWVWGVGSWVWGLGLRDEGFGFGDESDVSEQPMAQV